MQIFTSFSPEVIELLKSGAVGVIPTDTLYGVVTPLHSERAVQRIYDVKGHDESRPIGTILINDPLQISDLVPEHELVRAQQFWPAPNSVILTVPDYLHYAHRGYGSLPFRVPNHDRLRSLLFETGPLATTSANHSGRAPAETVEQAMEYFREAVDFYVDGGNLSGNHASSILRFDNKGEVEQLR